MIRAVVFDLDYTLAVPERDRQSILDAATARTGAPSLSRAAYLDAHARHLDAETRDPIFADLLADAGAEVSPAALNEAYQAAILDALVPVEGAAELVRELAAEYRVGLLTNGPVAAQREKIEHLGWTDLFDATVVTGTLDAGKPDARAFEAVLADLGVAPDEAVYVGDDVEADVAGAKNAGLRAVQVLFPGGPAPDPAADETVERGELRTALPDLLRSL